MSGGRMACGGSKIATPATARAVCDARRPNGFRSGCRHPDRNPFSLRASRTALAVAGVAIFEPPQAIRPPDIARLGAIVIGLPFVEGVAEDLDHTTLGPPAVLRLAGWHPVHGETPLNGIGTQLLFHTPAIDLPDHLGFRLVDHEMLWRGGRLVHVGVAIGWIAPVDPALAGRKQLPAAGALVDQGAFILRKDALHLEEHLFFGARPQALMHEDDLTARPGQLFD